MSGELRDSSPPSSGGPPAPATPPPLPAVPPPLPRSVLPLEYGPSPSGRRGPMAARVALGFFAYVALSVGWAYVGLGSHAPPRAVAAVWAVMTLGLLGLALYLRIRHGRAGYGYGILLALLAGGLLIAGLVLLIIGLCASRIGG